MSDLLILFAGLVVAPVGFTLAVIVAFIYARDLIHDWRHHS